MKRNICPVILCGGSGTRLWPLSRNSFPKQFLNLDQKENKTLLQKTLMRISTIKNLESPIIICNEEHRFIVAEQLREIKINPKIIILEPFGKNTAPAITIAALQTLQADFDPHLLILSSDHEIKEEKKFLDVIEKALLYSEKGRLVTFGVVPTSPETGYGYIKSSKPIHKNNIIGENICEFIEKPNFESAKKFLHDDSFFWNSGIFLFKASTLLNETEKLAPEIINNCRSSINIDSKDFDFQRLNKEIFKNCPNISIDVAIMEKTNLGTVLPLDAGWSDIGSWNSVWEISKKDENGNVILGNVQLENTRNCYFRSEKRLVTGVGLDNLVIIETDDAVLVANKNNSQDIKKVVKKLKDNNISEGLEHQRIYRPWGNYDAIAKDSRWQVKLIKVKPGNQLSLQMHHHRAEHWIVVQGTAKVDIDEKVLFLTENESTFIPLRSIHRLTNPGKIDLILIEVQSGAYLGEDDITRFEDNYGRLDN